MNTKHIALILSVMMGANCVTLAAPASENSPFVDQKLVARSIGKRSAEVKQTLAQIQALIECLEEFRGQNEKTRESYGMKSVKMVIAGLGAGSGAATLVGPQTQSTAKLALAGFGGLLSMLLEKYVKTNTINISEMQGILAASQRNLVDVLAQTDNSDQTISREDADLIAGAVAEIGKINELISPKTSDIQSGITDVQTSVAVTALFTLVVSYSVSSFPKWLKEIIVTKAPYLGKLGDAIATKAPFLGKMKDALATKAPNLATKTQAGADKVGKTSLWGLGLTNVAPYLSAAVGMSGTPAEAQIDLIISKLYEAKVNLIAGSSSYLSEARKNSRMD